MTIIKADKYAVTINDGKRTESYPTGSFVVTKSGEKEVTILSSLHNSRFKINIDEVLPRVVDHLKGENPDSEQEGTDGEIWKNQKTQAYFIYEEDKFRAVNVSKVVDLYIHKLSSFLNGAENLK